MNRNKFIKVLGILPVFGSAYRVTAKNKIPLLADVCKTERDQEGPYFKANSPERGVIETEGTPLRIEGRILRSNDCQTPVPNAIVDVWHCDEHGSYDNEGFKCRGYVKTDAEGKYSFTTIFPPPYARRPRHIHFKVRANGFKELTTQLYFQGDSNIKNDFARNAGQERVIALTTESKLKKGRFDIYL